MLVQETIPVLGSAEDITQQRELLSLMQRRMSYELFIVGATSRLVINSLGQWRGARMELERFGLLDKLFVPFVTQREVGRETLKIANLAAVYENPQTKARSASYLPLGRIVEFGGFEPVRYVDNCDASLVVQKIQELESAKRMGILPNLIPSLISIASPKLT